MSIANVHDEAITISAAPGASAAALIRDVARQHMAVGNADALRWLCSHPDTPEDVLLEICDHGLCLDELGHRRGPRRLLEKLADERHYPEAIISLALELYVSALEPEGAFAAFVGRHADHAWVLESLAHKEASSPEKEAAYSLVLNAHPEAARMRTIQDSCRAERRARQSNDPAEIESLYATRDPAVWRALAGNPATPNALLAELAKARDIQCARETRNLAADTLSRR
ncbi:MAG TPA: hypothetical protein VND64_12175 [Pirellulales bacterium]|nr:hypothetical protein [Pirellulales bacterium]